MTDREELKRLAEAAGFAFDDSRIDGISLLSKVYTLEHFKRFADAICADHIAQLEAKEAEVAELRKQADDMRKVINGSALLIQEIRASREADIERAIRLAFSTCGYDAPAENLDALVYVVISQMKEPTNG